MHLVGTTQIHKFSLHHLQNLSMQCSYVIGLATSSDHLSGNDWLDVLHCLVEDGHGVEHHLVLALLVGPAHEREGERRRKEGEMGRRGGREGGRPSIGLEKPGKNLLCNLRSLDEFQ